VTQGKFYLRFVVVLISTLLISQFSIAATVSTRSLTHRKKAQVRESQPAKRHIHRLVRSRTTAAARLHRRHRYYERFYTSSYAQDIAEGDQVGGEDPIVRRAALDALGNMNGTLVAIEPTSGRILAMVNQKLALSSGAQPCSTIKLSVALAALNEGIITKETEVRLGGRYRMNLTMALARSNNAYFETLASASWRATTFPASNLELTPIRKSLPS
jgi:penicillin-binding protein 2